MSIKSELAQQLVSGLQDIRCAAPRLVLDQYFKRTIFGSGIPEYRITNSVNGNIIQDLSEFTSLITEHNIIVQVSNAGHASNFTDKCKPVKVIMKDLKVTLFPESLEDGFFSTNVSRLENRICFVMGYVGDNDENLPMKILDIYLIGIR